MSLKCGIIGLPNVGKSTLFNCLTCSNIPAQNFPFCTIDANFANVNVPDKRLDLLYDIIRPKKITPAVISFVDIAGLITGASQGEGLGNKFLNNIRDVSIILHLVRVFENQEIINTQGKINPTQDIDIINTELILEDIKYCKQYLKMFHRDFSKTFSSKEILNSCLEVLERGESLRSAFRNSEYAQQIEKFNFLTFKPTIYLLNLDSQKKINHNTQQQIQNKALQENAVFLSLCAINSHSSSHTKELQKLIEVSSNLLDLKTFFSVGKKEIKAWSIKKNATTFQAARKIHTDIQKGFIKAKIISFLDFVKTKNTKLVKNSGKMKVYGKDHIFHDGDIIHFLFNV